MKYRTCILTLCSALGLLGSASGSAYAQKATLVIHNNTNATLAVSAKQVHTGVLTEVIQVPPLTKRTLPAFLPRGTVQLRAVPPKVRPRVEPILGKDL